MILIYIIVLGILTCSNSFSLQQINKFKRSISLSSFKKGLGKKSAVLSTKLYGGNNDDNINNNSTTTATSNLEVKNDENFFSKILNSPPPIMWIEDIPFFSSNNSTANPKFSLGSAFGGAFVGVVLTLVGLFAPVLGDIQEMYGLDSPPSSSSSSSVGEQGSSSKGNGGIIKSVKLFEDILYDLKLGYVDEVEPNRLFETAISAMLKTLDPYTEFENLSQAKNMRESVSGRYGGVGMVISATKDRANLPSKANPKISVTPKTNSDSDTLLLDKNVDKQKEINLEKEKEKEKGKESKNEKFGNAFKGITVVDAFEGYAYDAGIRAGDRLLTVAGVDVSKLGVEQVRDLLRGDPDSDVVITYQRDGDGDGNASGQSPSPSSVTIKRKEVRLSDIRLATYIGDPADGIGYISLTGFNAGAGRDFRTAFLMLRYSAPNGLNGLVLDLRGNPGGLLDAAVEIASYLVPANSDIVSAKSKTGPEIMYRSTSEPIRPPDMKLAVLVNGGSASASEILAGAVQDLDAGTIIGPSRTYGKGLVQKIVPLPYDSALKYTIAKYYTPSGRCIQSIKYSGGRSNINDKKNSNSNSNGDDMINENQKDIKDKDGKSKDVDSNGKIISTEGGGDDEGEGEGEGYADVVIAGDGAKLVADVDRKIFYTRNGRPVRDGGGIEPDIIVPTIKASPSQSIFTSQGVYFDFVKDFFQSNTKLRPLLKRAAQMEKEGRAEDIRYASVIGMSPQLAQFLVLPEAADEISQQDAALNSAMVMPSQKNEDYYWGGKGKRYSSDLLFNNFKNYAQKRIKSNDINVESISKPLIDELDKELKESGLTSMTNEINKLRDGIKQGIIRDMESSKDLIVEDLEVAILSRELPDRLLMYKNIAKDPQVLKASEELIKQKQLELASKGGDKNGNGDVDSGGSGKTKKSFDDIKDLKFRIVNR